MQRLESRQPALHGDLRNLTRLELARRGANLPDVFRGRPTAAADDVDERAFAVVAQYRRRLLCRLIVFTKGVGQPRVRVSAYVSIGDARKLLHVGPQLRPAEGAVEPHRQRPGVADGIPEGLGRLARQHAPRGVRDGAGNDDGDLDADLIEQAVGRVDRSLGVERVDDRLDEKQIDSAHQQGAHRVGIRRDEVVEGHVAEARIVHVRGQRTHTRRGTERACHECGTLLGPRKLVCHLARNLRCTVVELGNECLSAIVRL